MDPNQNHYGNPPGGNPYGQPQGGPYPPPPPYGARPTNGVGIASVVTGSIALVFSIIPLIGFLSWLLAPAAIIMGIIGLNRRDAPRGTAIAGLATGALALIICIMWVVVLGAFFANLPDATRNY